VNKEHNPGTVTENITNSTVENNHVTQDTEATFSDEEEESPLRFVIHYLSVNSKRILLKSMIREINFANLFVFHRIVTKLEDEEDEDDVPLSAVKLKNEQKNANCVVKKEDIASHFPQIESEKLRNDVETLCTETDNEARCQAMERIVQDVLDNDFDTDAISSLANCISTILSSQITTQIFPSGNLNEEMLVDSISTPLFVMFRNQFQLCKEENPRRKLLARVLAEMQSVQTKIGYLLLYFLKVWGREEEKREGELKLVQKHETKKKRKTKKDALTLPFVFSSVLNDVKASAYKDFCTHRDKKLDACLIADLKVHECSTYINIDVHRKCLKRINFITCRLYYSFVTRTTYLCCAISCPTSTRDFRTSLSEMFSYCIWSYQLWIRASYKT